MAVLFQRQGTGNAALAAGNRTDRAPAAFSTAGLIERIIEQRLVTAEFQPIVRLSTGEVVGFETLARGPADSVLSSPAAMFKAAAAMGAAAELDDIAHVAAFNSVTHMPPVEGLTFFTNFHTATRSKEPPEDIAEILDRAPRELRLVAELSEYDLSSDPISAIAAAQRVREMGVRLALDNLGSLDSLPLLPLLQPDVIKLDPALLAIQSRQRLARIVDALVDYANRSGAQIVGQGIEREEQLSAVTSSGAAFGQGYLFGPPVTLPVLSSSTVQEPVDLTTRLASPDITVTPFEMLRAERTPMVMEAPFLQALGTHLEERVDTCADPFTMFVVTPGGSGFSGSNPSRLRALGRKASMMALLSPNPPVSGGREVRVGQLAHSDPLHDDYVLAIVTPTGGALLTARPVDRSGGSYECIVTHDRQQVVEASRSLLARYMALASDGKQSGLR